MCFTQPIWITDTLPYHWVVYTLNLNLLISLKAGLLRACQSAKAIPRLTVSLYIHNYLQVIFISQKNIFLRYTLPSKRSFTKETFITCLRLLPLHTGESTLLFLKLKISDLKCTFKKCILHTTSLVWKLKLNLFNLYDHIF